MCFCASIPPSTELCTTIGNQSDRRWKASNARDAFTPWTRSWVEVLLERYKTERSREAGRRCRTVSPRREESMEAVERESRCLLAGGFVGVYFVPFEILSIGGTPRRYTSSFLFFFCSAARYLVAKILRSRSRHNGRNKRFDRLYTRNIGGRRRRTAGGKYQRVYTVERVRVDRSSIVLSSKARGKLDPSRTRKVINLTSYEARLMALTRMIHDHACARVCMNHVRHRGTHPDPTRIAILLKGGWYGTRENRARKDDEYTRFLENCSNNLTNSTLS